MKRHENAIFIIWPLDKIIGFGIIEIYRKVSIRCENEQMMSGGKSIICIIMCMLHLYVKIENARINQKVWSGALFRPNQTKGSGAI